MKQAANSKAMLGHISTESLDNTENQVSVGNTKSFSYSTYSPKIKLHLRASIWLAFRHLFYADTEVNYKLLFFISCLNSVGQKARKTPV